MKKIICMLAMALLAIGAAQAREQVRKMVVRQNDGQEMRFKTADIEEVTFETVAVPTTVEEAEAMLVGYWKCNNPFLSFVLGEDINYFESTAFLIVTEDLEILLGYKAVDYLPNEYAGKILVFGSFGNEIIVNSDDPTMGDFFRNDYDEGAALSFMNLDQNSFDAHFESYVEDGPTSIQDGTFYRVEPFEFIIAE